MILDLLNYLQCPACGGAIELAEGTPQNGRLEEGTLRCKGCGKVYPVTNRIVRMVPEMAPGAVGGDRVDLTVRNYSAYQGEVYAPLAERLSNDAILKARTGLELADFAGKLCLDAGCGVGRFSRVMARAGARHVVALDVGNSIDEAKAQTDPALPVSWVQGHILQLPLRAASFDRVISIGVLHHTANPHQGFQRVAERVVSGGSLSVYLYNLAYLPWKKQGDFPLWWTWLAVWQEPLRRLIARLPKSVRLAICQALYRLRVKVIEPLKQAGPVGRRMAWLIQAVVPRDSYKPLENAASNIARNFDFLSTPYAYSHELEEVIDWFVTEPGFNRLHVTPYRLSITGWKDAEADPEAPVQISYCRPRSIAPLEAAGVEVAPSA